MVTLTLVGGIPRAGKSSLCDAIEAADAGFTHVPLDRYVLPVPPGWALLAWIATPACIAWDHLLAHLTLLESGVPCYSPRPAWERGWREWACAGGALTRGAGRRMAPAAVGYLLAGTHAFACPPRRLPTLRVFVHTPLVVVAERLGGRPASRRAARALVRARLAPNTAAILRARRRAHAVVDGTADRPAQVRSFLDAHARAVAGMTPGARPVSVPTDEASRLPEQPGGHAPSGAPGGPLRD